ncbi:MAG: alanine--glyoxylate aminotransferase family protein [Phycisphaeraceae bacterium]
MSTTTANNTTAPTPPATARPTHPQRTLLGPGPSDVPPAVLAALARPTVGHLDPFFLQTMDELRTRLKQLFRTDNDMTLAVSGTGSAGMETLFVNLLEPGDKVLVGVNGVFGSRMADVAERCGGDVVTLEQPWGSVFTHGEILNAVDREKPALVALVHAETSTGAAQPVAGLGQAIRDRGALFILDCVTSLAGMPVEIDDWLVDAAYSGTQKCLSCPPGLAPITLSDRAVERIDRRKNKVQSWYLDLTMLRNYWGQDRVYHHTAPTNMLVALNEAARLALAEGLEPRWARHRDMHEIVRRGLTELGFAYLTAPEHTLPMLNAVTLPEGLDDATARRSLLDTHGIEVGAGLGPYKGKLWRIGLMGHSATQRNVTLLLAALRELLHAA